MVVRQLDDAGAPHQLGALLLDGQQIVSADQDDDGAGAGRQRFEDFVLPTLLLRLMAEQELVGLVEDDGAHAAFFDGLAERALQAVRRRRRAPQLDRLIDQHHLVRVERQRELGTDAAQLLQHPAVKLFPVEGAAAGGKNRQVEHGDHVDLAPHVCGKPLLDPLLQFLREGGLADAGWSG